MIVRASGWDNSLKRIKSQSAGSTAVLDRARRSSQPPAQRCESYPAPFFPSLPYSNFHAAFGEGGCFIAKSKQTSTVQRKRASLARRLLGPGSPCLLGDAVGNHSHIPDARQNYSLKNAGVKRNLIMTSSYFHLPATRCCGFWYAEREVALLTTWGRTPTRTNSRYMTVNSTSSTDHLD